MKERKPVRSRKAGGPPGRGETSIKQNSGRSVGHPGRRGPGVPVVLVFHRPQNQISRSIKDLIDGGLARIMANRIACELRDEGLATTDLETSTHAPALHSITDEISGGPH